MTRYIELGALFLAVAAFVRAVVFLFRAVGHFIRMLGHYRSERHNLVANLLPFLVLFIPGLFTEQGNLHRAGFVNNLVLFLCCVAVIAIIYEILGVTG